MNAIALNSNEFDMEKKTFFTKDLLKISHLIKIMKVSIHKEVKVCLLNQSLAIGKITNITDDCITGNLISLFEGRPANINLLIGACRPPTAKKILEHGTTLGMKSLTFFNASLSEKSYLDSNLYKNNEFKRFLEAGLSQSAAYYQVPIIKCSKELPSQAHLKCSKFLLLPGKYPTFLNYKKEINNHLALAFGPERGLTKKKPVSF